MTTKARAIAGRTLTRKRDLQRISGSWFGGSEKLRD
jgi:hypothetical protein